MNISDNFLIKFIVESDAIEGIANDRNDLKNKILGNTHHGHVGVLLSLKASSQDRSQRINGLTIRTMQGLIVSERYYNGTDTHIHPRHIGLYRDVDVSVGGRMCAPVCEVVPRINDLIGEMFMWQEKCTGFSKKENLKIVGDFHFRFLRIHPFADGNGRTSRALALYMLAFAGIKPFIFTNGDKYETYYRCFDDGENSSLMQEYFLAKATRHI